MKNIIKITIFAGSLMLSLSCSSGYVEQEPTYVEVYRPVAPAPHYVWVNDNYVYRNRVYVHKNGYWAKPRPNKVYVQGHWAKHPRGYHWVNGRWTRR